MIQVDGSMMEGGGQLLRMATSYSAILGEPVNVYNIRARRSPPGLKPQHLTTLKAAAQISRAEVKGAREGSKQIEFKPSEIKGGSYSFDIGTAGSITLLLQCLTPIAAFAKNPTDITVRGGTAVKWSPPTPFLANVVWPAFKQMGLECSLNVKRHGFYPRGGGEVTAKIRSTTRLTGLSLRYKEIETIHGISVCGKLAPHVARRQAQSASKQLIKNRYQTDFEVKTLTGIYEPYSPGSMICLWADSMYLGADTLGERGKPAEIVGREAADLLLNQIKTGAEVDLHTCDHLILPCSLASGETRFKTSDLTLHTLTAIELAKMFTDAKFKVKGREGEPAELTCIGVGFNK